MYFRKSTMVLLLAVGIVSVETLPQAVPYPEVGSLTPEVRARLATEVAQLEASLTGQWWAASLWPAAEWGSYECARFLAGWLASSGYRVQLARLGDTWWAMCEPMRGSKLWFPVIPEFCGSSRPTAGLGAIPWADRAALRPQERYYQLDELRPLPHNVAPTARIRTWGKELPGERITFDASLSYDPDGALLLILWEFGDGYHKEGLRVGHVFDSYGRYEVVLTVIDNAGAVARQTLPLVLAPEEGPGREGTGQQSHEGCGCGG